MHRSVALSLITALFLLLAGCNTLGGGGGTTVGDDIPTDESAYTPAPVPTDTPTPTPGPADVPGITEQGVDNLFTLATAHGATLRNASFSVRRNTTVWYRNGTLAIRNVERTRVSEDDGRFHTRVRVTSTLSPGARSSNDTPEPLVREIWSNDNRLLLKTSYGGNTAYNRMTFDEASPGRIDLVQRQYIRTGTEYVGRSLNGTEARLLGRTTYDGRTVYRLRSSRPIVRVGSAPVPVEVLGNTSAYSLVGPRGIVLRSTRTYPARLESNGAPVTVTSTVRFTDVGSTTVERPSWVESALQRTDTTERPRRSGLEAQH